MVHKNGMRSNPLWLASGSPRRSELLTRTGFCFEVDAANVPEDEQGTPGHIVTALARRKAEAIAHAHAQSLILAADTIVVLGEDILGKPQDACDAARMLSCLSGRWHSVFTGVCLIDTARGLCDVSVARTDVHVTQLTPAQIAAYIATGEPLDKAGAYGIQGMFEMYIEAIHGSYSNVMGLPMRHVRQRMCEIGAAIQGDR